MGYTFLDAKASLVHRNDLGILVRSLRNNPDNLDRTFHMDSLVANPRTSTYCNPSDIVWVSWIEENADTYSFYVDESGNERELKVTLTKVVRNTINGEEFFMLPSKKIREIIGSCQLVGERLENINQKMVAFIHKISEGFHKDNQELVLVDKELLEAVIRKEGYSLVWIVTVFKEKNPLNESLPKGFHVRRSRKYFVWVDGDGLNSMKFWDEEFTNVRDSDKAN